VIQRERERERERRQAGLYFCAIDAEIHEELLLHDIEP